MATMICLVIAEDGTMSVGASQSAEMPQDMKAMPVKGIDEALSTIKELAGAASMPGDETAAAAPEQESPQEDAQPGDDEEQEAAMMGAYRPGQTGR